MTLRLLADDLTGALDTAAEFAGAVRPLHAFWHGGLPDVLPANAALDSGTRELGAAEAIEVVARLVPTLADAGIAFKKIDSLMRGQTIAELAACFAHGRWTSCILAPAFPFQGRVTRAGRQYARGHDGEWSPAGPDLVEALRAAGAAAHAAKPGAPMQPGIGVFDAETDADLDAIVAYAQTDAPVLWCGTGGLARALASSEAVVSTTAEAAVSTTLPRPILGLFGSDQAVTETQLAACVPHRISLSDGGPADARRMARQMDANGVALASFSLPSGLSRHDAAQRIGEGLKHLAEHLPRPGSLLVAGGETLRALCIALGASSLELQGRILPGLPRSVLRGGRWDGVAVVSKSGAFGPPHLLRDLLALNELYPERTP